MVLVLHTCFCEAIIDFTPPRTSDPTNSPSHHHHASPPTIRLRFIECRSSSSSSPSSQNNRDIHASSSIMTAFHINDNRNDRSASYEEGVLNRSSGSGPSFQANQKKKPYRARGCRGGASRKGRKKQTITTDTRQDEENDPHRLNNNTEQRQYNDDLPESLPPCKIMNASSDMRGTSGGPDESAANVTSHSERNIRSQLFVPYCNGSNIHQGFSESASEADIEVELLDRSLNRGLYSRGAMPILPMRCDDEASHAMLRTNNNSLRDVTVPTMSERRSDDGDDQSTGGGFSFFCISPCSFLSGQRKKRGPFF